MRNEKIEKHIFSAIDKIPIDLLSTIKSQPVEKMDNHDFITKQDTQSDSRILWKPLMALGSMAAVFLIIFIGWWSQYNPVDSLIYLDVNPSFEVSVDKNEQVIELKTLKPEDVALIDSIDYRGKDLYQVTEQLLDILISEGFIDAAHHTMLVSVLNDNMEIRNRQANQLNSSIKAHLQNQSIQGVVLRQGIAKSNTIDDFAVEYEVSVGKMTFIRNLIILDSTLKVEDLAVLSLEDLVRLSASTKLDIKQIIDVDQDLEELYRDTDDNDDEFDEDDDDDEFDEDDDNDEFDEDDDLDDNDCIEDDDNHDMDEIQQGELISIEKAIEIALGLTGGGVVEDIDLDEDDGSYIYEIEIVNDGIEYDLEIDAVTGKVLTFEIED